jgi:hypothetical protein
VDIVVGGWEEELMSWGREGREGLRYEETRVTDEALDDVTTYRAREVRRLDSMERYGYGL